MEAKRNLEEQVADQVASQLKTERARVAAEEAKKAKATSDKGPRPSRLLRVLLKGGAPAI